MYRSTIIHGGAGEDSVGEWQTQGKRLNDFRDKSFVMHIASRLKKALRSPKLLGKEEIIHVDDIHVHHFPYVLRKGALT